MATKTSSLALLLLATSTASAAITIPTVSVGDAGNPADGTGYGAVSYDYEIGTHEVTNSQYTNFLNAVAAKDTYGLYPSNIQIDRSGTSGNYNYSVGGKYDDRPVNDVSFWDAARFANWLTNGQPEGPQGNGTTETGMYNLGGDKNPDNSSVTRQLDSGFAVASGDEWYKAAYYDGNGGYYDYPTKSDDPPTSVSPANSIESNNANYNGILNRITDVGAYENSASHYGTFDQGGNVWEWNDEIVLSGTRNTRGGSFLSDSGTLKSSFSNDIAPTSQFGTTGFRITSFTAIPEPSSYGAIFGIVGLAAAVFFRRRRRRE